MVGLAKRFGVAIHLCAAAVLLFATAARASTTRPDTCLALAIPQPQEPVLTNAQAIAAVHQPLSYVRQPARRSAQCQWNGRRLPPARATPYRQYQVQLWLSVHAPFRSVSAAKHDYGAMVDAFGQPTRAPGVGSEAAFIPGQDEVTAQLLVRGGRDVFEVSLNSPLDQRQQRAQLTVIARDVLSRLARAGGSARMMPPAGARSSVLRGRPGPTAGPG
jgi:hypothetical protein